jgi:hypothetical protein
MSKPEPKMATTTQSHREKPLMLTHSVKSVLLVVMVFLTLCVATPIVRADSCKPDVSKRDLITKKQVDKWQQVLNSSGFLSAALMNDDVTFSASIERSEDGDFIMISAEKVNGVGRYIGAEGDKIIFGFKDGEPLTFVVTEATNGTDADMFGKVHKSSVWTAALSANQVAAMRVALTTKQVDAIRIDGQISGKIDLPVSDKNGKKLMEKFGCFYQALDKSSLPLTSTAADGHVKP